MLNLRYLRLDSGAVLNAKLKAVVLVEDMRKLYALSLG